MLSELHSLFNRRRNVKRLRCAHLQEMQVAPIVHFVCEQYRLLPARLFRSYVRLDASGRGV